MPIPDSSLKPDADDRRSHKTFRSVPCACSHTYPASIASLTRSTCQQSTVNRQRSTVSCQCSNLQTPGRMEAGFKWIQMDCSDWRIWPGIWHPFQTKRGHSWLLLHCNLTLLRSLLSLLSLTDAMNVQQAPQQRGGHGCCFDW